MLGPGQAQADADDPGTVRIILQRTSISSRFCASRRVSVLSPRSNLTGTSCSSRRAPAVGRRARLSPLGRRVCRTRRVGRGAAGGGRGPGVAGSSPAEPAACIANRSMHRSSTSTGLTAMSASVHLTPAANDITDVWELVRPRAARSGESVTSPFAGSARRAETRSRRDAGRGSSPASDAHPPRARPSRNGRTTRRDRGVAAKRRPRSPRNAGDNP